MGGAETGKTLPGKIAEKRRHPQTDAIRVSGWVGLITLGVFWPLALIWAYTTTYSMRAAQALVEVEDASEEETEAKEEKEEVGA